MNNKNKFMQAGSKILAVAAIASLALAGNIAQAQPRQDLPFGNPDVAVYSLATNTAVTFGGKGWTNSINSYTSYTNSTRIDCTGKRELFLQFTGQWSSNNAGGVVTVWLTKNVSGLGVGTNNPVNTQTNFDNVGISTTPYWIINNANGNTGSFTSTTNLTVAGGVFAPYVFINIISNSSFGAGNNLTNYSIRAVVESLQAGPRLAAVYSPLPPAELTHGNELDSLGSEGH